VGSTSSLNLYTEGRHTSIKGNGGPEGMCYKAISHFRVVIANYIFEKNVFLAM
jgi:hypothetical protein